MNSKQKERTSDTLEENFKKAVTEMLVLHLFSEQPRYIGELPELMKRRSGGKLAVVFPYAAFYRIFKAELITEEKKRTAADGRLRQYYQITDVGQAYLSGLMETYDRVITAVSGIVYSRRNG